LSFAFAGTDKVVSLATFFVLILFKQFKHDKYSPVIPYFIKNASRKMKTGMQKCIPAKNLLINQTGR